jgi:hypothetical protein
MKRTSMTHKIESPTLVDVYSLMDAHVALANGDDRGRIVRDTGKGSCNAGAEGDRLCVLGRGIR